MPELRGDKIPKPGEDLSSRIKNPDEPSLVGNDTLSSLSEADKALFAEFGLPTTPEEERQMEEATRRRIVQGEEDAKSKKGDIIAIMRTDPLQFSKDIIVTAENLSTNTAFPSSSTIDKLEIALALRNQLEQEGVLRRERALYIGSGLDIEYPLLLGSRRLVLADPIFQEQESITALKEKIRVFDSDAQETQKGNNSEFKFFFDFGRGKEEVTVEAIPQSAQTLPRQERLGAIITYLSGPFEIFDFPDLLKSLTQGGYLLSTNQSSSPILISAVSSVQAKFPEDYLNNKYYEELDKEMTNVAQRSGMERVGDRRPVGEQSYKIIDKGKFDKFLESTKQHSS